ncbi:MAG: CdaR family protein [Syntrophales bacterium]|nr:CdaR family protein [Syntrophales bacterium]MDD5641548.1 CdaR family protein [Syntrophales bacterium]
MKGFIGSLGRNKGLKLLSLLLAVALWAAVGVEEPTETTLSMALELANPPQHMMITSEIPSSLQVRVHGPGSVIRRLTQSRLVQTIDLSGFKLGAHTIPLGPKNFSFPRGVQVTRVQPNPLVLTLASAMVRTLEVHPVLEGKPPKGYEITGVRARPSQIRVKGPTTEIADLKFLPTIPLDVSQLTVGATLAAELDLKNLHLAPQDQTPILVDVEVEPKKISRTISGVPVAAIPQKAHLSPSRVSLILKGPMLELRSLKPAELMATVDTSNLSPGRHRLNVSVNLPSSLELVRIHPATITARIEKSP